MSVDVVAYSSAWQRLFEEEATRLRQHLQPWLVGDVHHIGSTAVPGLAAKPIIDMLAGVHDLNEAGQSIPVLVKLGYLHADHRPHEALWFYKQRGEDYGRRSHQLHLTQVGSTLWLERLAFRDALRANEGLRAEYETLKQALVITAETVRHYTQGKRAFVSRVLTSAGIDLA